ncbi:DNA-methyltransferase [Raineya orbicola]|uniref:Methyltransferase n=1 Tax=Raineya orbicola TaxID=2016530 RepID=A0A2N3IHM5_9BACT|nr:site-specific DNA-methyltransferase [Raineya orbicola]PKQ69829.1 DNA modification methylase [Raineya orbicola]
MKNQFICGDALLILKQLPDSSVDMGVTSPPYNKQENKKGWLVENVKYDSATDKKDETLYQKEQIEVLNELYRVIKPGGSFFYNHKIRWEKGVMLHPIQWLSQTQWNIRQEIVWDRMIAANIRGWRFWQVDERIYWLYKPKNNKDLIGEELLSKHALLTSIWRFSPEQKVEHPAPFPLALPVRCIYAILNEKEGTVIDPYCGSGTTCVASKLLGKNFIGIDISQEYLKIAQKRLENYLQEEKVMLEELTKHIVRKTFQERKKEGYWDKRLQKKEVQTKLFE